MRYLIGLMVVLTMLGPNVFAQDVVEIDSQLSENDYSLLRLASIEVTTSYVAEGKPNTRAYANTMGFIIEEDGVWKLVMIGHGTRQTYFPERGEDLWIPDQVEIVIPAEIDDYGNILVTENEFAGFEGVFGPFYLFEANFRQNGYFDGMTSWDLDPAQRDYLLSRGYVPLVKWSESSMVLLNNFISVTSVKAYNAELPEDTFIDPVFYQIATLQRAFDEIDYEDTNHVYDHSLVLDVVDGTNRKNDLDGNPQEMGVCYGYSGSASVLVEIGDDGVMMIPTDEQGRPYVVGSISSMIGIGTKYLQADNGLPSEVKCTTEDAFVFVTVFYNEID